MSNIEAVENPQSIIGFSPDFRPVYFDAIGRRVTVAIRCGGKVFPYMLVINVSKEVARDANWAGESYVVLGVSRNPTEKRIEIRHCPDTAHGARAIGKSGRSYYQIKVPYVKDFHAVVPEICSAVDVKVHTVDKTRLVIDCQGIRPTKMPEKKQKK